MLKRILNRGGSRREPEPEGADHPSAPGQAAGAGAQREVADEAASPTGRQDAGAVAGAVQEWPAGQAVAAGPSADLGAATLETATAKTRSGLFERLAGVFGAVDISDETWDDLETQLVRSDVGAATAVAMVSDLRERARLANVRRATDLPSLLGQVMVRTLERFSEGSTSSVGAGVWQGGTSRDRAKPWIVLVVGVNGSGKTTTVAKIAAWHKRAGRRVVVVAADTFRAAAIEQLQAWGERIGVPVIAGHAGGDPGAVVFDALQSQAAKQADIVLIDTAGRLHTQANLMAELGKVRGVIKRASPAAPHETLLVLDATTGQNGLAQATKFTAAVEVNALALAKLDSSSKGGVAFAVTRELGLPIAYVGTGEGVGDLAPFDARAYVAGVLGQATGPATR